MKEEEMDPQEKITVRTTFRPDQDVEMTATEAEDLRRQGLLVPVEGAPAQADRELEGKPETRQRPARKGEQA